MNELAVYLINLARENQKKEEIICRRRKKNKGEQKHTYSIKQNNTKKT